MSKTHNLSASKVDLALYGCSYGFRGDVVAPERLAGAAAARGNTVHRASDCHHKGLPMPAFHDDTEALWLSLKRWLVGQLAFTHSEIPLLYDAANDSATLCETGPGGERDYLGVTERRMPMRLDLVRVEDGVVWVCDIKTGSRSNTSPASENMQIATQAVAAARYFGVGRAQVGLVFPMKTKCHEPEWHMLGPDELDAHAGRLHRVLRSIPESVPVRGGWCWSGCPLGPSRNDRNATCPEWQVEAAG